MATRSFRPRTTGALLLSALAAAAAPSTAFAADGPITTLAGTTAGLAGDGGPATQAQINAPRAVAFAPDGRVLIADSANQRVRQVATDGVITTIALVPPAPVTFVPPPGLSGVPSGVAYDLAGVPLVVDTTGNFVGRISPNNTVTVIAGTRGASGFAGDGGAATAARFNAPTGMAVGPDGATYVADTGNDRIRRIGTNGIISTVAGSAVAGFSGDGGQARSASLNGPRGVAVAADGGLLIADTGNNRIRRVDPRGVITTVAGSSTGSFAGDGAPATDAALNAPTGVAPLRLGGFVIADTGNDRLRRVTPLGTIFSISGGAKGLAGDDGPASAGRLNAPAAIAPDGSGGFVVADTGNSRIRGIASDGNLPGPVPGRSLRLSPAGGFTRAFIAGKPAGQPIREPDLVQLSSRVDSEKGQVKIETGRPDGTARTANVTSGQFAIEQPQGPIETTFRLTAPMNGCRAFEGGAGSGSAAKKVAGKPKVAKRSGRPVASAAAAPKKKKKTKRKRRTRKIFVQSDGGHRTSGRYSDAVVRGTKWTIQDYCTSTRVTVQEGLVEVFDNVKGKSVFVPAGERYISRLKKAKK